MGRGDGYLWVGGGAVAGPEADNLPGRHPSGRHPPNGYCSGRYASYWNAFLFWTKVCVVTDFK